MIAQDFYSVIDGEIEALLEKYQDDPYLRRHNDKNNQKPYGLLLWFLEFYGGIRDYVPYITDGHDDSSRDIILDLVDGSGKVFYVVQSKWNNQAKVSSNKDLKDEVQKALSDFETILRGGKEILNEKAHERLEDLKKHLQANGEVRFIFLTLSEYKDNAKENIDSFMRAHQKTYFEVIDITRIKTDYIDKHFKKILPNSPLRRYKDPATEMLTLNIERLGGQRGNYMYVDKPFSAYTFFVRPKTLHDLFERYEFALFDKNIRNPLLQSQFNENIERTVLENPAYFWYYNNGITGITELLPTVREEATSVEIGGLQIINGAQTVYSIYRAYQNATELRRSTMDQEALISLRLLKSGSKDFDFNVTRFTNSQNPVTERDFWANDEVQIRLQQEFYQTKYWYEKRRGEFREVPEGITVVSNEIVAMMYLAFYLQDPVSLINSLADHNSKNLCFVSHKESPLGLYEKIFNEKTQAKNVEASMYMGFLLLYIYEISIDYSEFGIAIMIEQYARYMALFTGLGFMKNVLGKYWQLKYGKEDIDVEHSVIQAFTTQNIGKQTIFIQAYDFIANVINGKANEIDYDNLMKFVEKNLTKYGGFERLTEELEQKLTDVSVIENRDISHYLEALQKYYPSDTEP